MKIALVCDFLTKFGGAQRVLLSLHELYPDAPIYCLAYDEIGTKGKFKDCQIIESSLGKLPPFLKKKTKYFLPSLPKRIEEFDFSDFDVVVSSSDSYSHGILTKPSTFHLCYCHTPTRYLWDWYHEYLKENNMDKGLKSLIVRNILHKIRIWDKVSSSRVDKWLANSQNVAERIEKYYRTNAEVLYPPVDTDKIGLNAGNRDDFYLVLSRLEPYKRVDLAVEACTKLNKNLVVIGEGTDLKNLKKIAGKTITFLGWQDEKDVYKHLQQAKAFIFPGEEDFGITPVEAMAAGTPVIAYNKGGVVESVADGKTGIFFDEPNADSLATAIEKFEKESDKFTPQNCNEQTGKFTKAVFQIQFKQILEKSYKEYQGKMNHEA